MSEIQIILNGVYHGKPFKVVNRNEQYIVAEVKKEPFQKFIEANSIDRVHESIKDLCEVAMLRKTHGHVSVSKLRQHGFCGDKSIFEFHVYAGSRKIPTITITEYGFELRDEKEKERLLSIEGFNR